MAYVAYSSLNSSKPHNFPMQCSLTTCGRKGEEEVLNIVNKAVSMSLLGIVKRRKERERKKGKRKRALANI